MTPEQKQKARERFARLADDAFKDEDFRRMVEEVDETVASASSAYRTFYWTFVILAIVGAITVLRWLWHLL